ncbi:neuromedin U [Corallococcus exiguus]|uniref:neuromedin U n=1 Tax=Corallococcus exiguus TaxID=83462 RepID=UPI001A8F0642|nr:neuromedin U [Corallococcus exiguus]MBN8465701.1 neuromedin U [Corallococcus exiguus]
MLLGLMGGLCCAVSSSAQEAPASGAGASEQDLVKATQNPVANLISVPFQDNLDLGIGPFHRARNTLNIQPVIPVPLTERWLLVNRLILPLVWQPNAAADTGGTFGLGDTSATFFISPRKPGALIWGVGPALLLPTATADVLGTGKWSVGPSIVALLQPDPWTFGVLANNVWSAFGSGDRPAVNQLLLQYFINYNLPKGWYLTSAPILTANWKADSDAWVVPFGGGVGKVFKLGRQPLNGSVSAFWNAVRPDAAPDWQLRAQLSFLFPEGKPGQQAPPAPPH